MNIRILAFGIVKELLNGSSTTLSLQDGLTIAELKTQLETAYPDMKKLRAYMVAVNDEYAADNLVIHPEDEIAIIPPVSGG